MQPFKNNKACMSHNNLFNKKTQENKTVQLQSITKPHKTMWVIFKLVFCVLLWFVTKIGADGSVLGNCLFAFLDN